MFSTLCCLLLVGVVRILIDYLSIKFEFLVPFVPYVTYALIAVAVVTVIMMVIYIIKAARSRDE